jgi:diketogulonate reductase-like aldo/keto reductase
MTIIAATSTIKLSNGVVMPRLALGTAPLQTLEDSKPDVVPADGTPEGEVRPSSRQQPPSFEGFLPEQATRSIAVALQHGLTENCTDKVDDNDDDDTTSIALHLETALYYRTHRQIAFVLNHHYMTGQLQSRKQVFITTKVFHPWNGFGTDNTCMPRGMVEEMTPRQVNRMVTKQCHQCLEELNCGYVDLMLLHWPGCWSTTSSTSPDEEMNDEDEQFKHNKIKNSAFRLAAWNALEEMYNKGWARAIGVSNFSVDHLKEFTPSNWIDDENDDGTRRQKDWTYLQFDDSNDDSAAGWCPPTIQPMVNQMEASVYCQHDDIRDYCLLHDIVPCAYSPFGRGVEHVNINNEPLVQQLAVKHSCTKGQIAFAYLLEKGYGCVISWSSTPDRLKSNLSYKDLPTLSESDIQTLDGLNRSNHSDASWGLLSPDVIP